MVPFCWPILETGKFETFYWLNERDKCLFKIWDTILTFVIDRNHNFYELVVHWGFL